MRDEQVHRVAGDRHELAVGEVHQPHDAEHQRQAEREQGVRAPEAQRVDDLLRRSRSDSWRSPHPRRAPRGRPARGPPRCATPPHDPATCTLTARQHVAARGHVERQADVLLDEQARVVPRAGSSASSSKICATTRGARPSEGSSSSTSCGRLMRERARASICCSPPDSVPASCFGARAGRGTGRTRRPCRPDPVLVPTDGRTEPQVVGHREVGEDAPALGRHRDPPPHDLLRAEPSASPARRRRTDPDEALHETGDRHQRRALAGAVGAEQRDDLTRVDFERYVAHGHDGPVARGHVLSASSGRSSFINAHRLSIQPFELSTLAVVGPVGRRAARGSPPAGRRHGSASQVDTGPSTRYGAGTYVRVRQVLHVA